ncbi:MAG TPA: DUF882 domain-containing protein [Stellaceae bacterium]|nr:DUF882 domain-containing protein [Stellaceae bacterium]
MTGKNRAQGRQSSRRRFLAGGLGAIACAAVWPAHAATRIDDRRRLSFVNLHTDEHVDLVYWADGSYEPGALRRIDNFLRDFRNGEIHQIDPQLLDLLVRLRARLRTTAPFHVISGYRSPATNAMLAAYTDGVASGSLHMQGMAIDIRVPNRPLRQLHKVALDLEAGGVGYYPRSDFVHVDTGRVRRWG